MVRILVNAAECVFCGDYIQSKHRHDYVSCKCGLIAVDGGVDYLRRTGNKSDLIEKSITTADDFELIREKFCRWNVVDNKYYLLKDISDEWLEAILEYYIPEPHKISDEILLVFLQEKQYRQLILEET